MARSRSDLLSSLGKLFAIFKKVADAVLAAGGSDEDIASIGANEQKAKEIAQLIIGKQPIIREESEGSWIGEMVYDGDRPRLQAGLLSLRRTDGTGHRFLLGDEVLVGQQGKLGRITRLWLPDEDSKHPTIEVYLDGSEERKLVHPHGISVPVCYINP